MTSQHRTPQKVLDGLVLTSAFQASTTATSSATPPETAIVTAEVDAGLDAVSFIVEGKETSGGNWIVLKYMVSDSYGDGARPGTDGLNLFSLTTFYAEVPAFPFMRVQILDAASGGDSAYAWINA